MTCQKLKASGDVINITEAAEILGVSEQWARVLMQSPDRVDRSEAGQPVYMYCRTRVKLIAQTRQCASCERKKQMGKRSCYLCQRKFAQSDLTSGICPNCQAYKWVKNFTHHGDCFAHAADIERLETLENAIKRFRGQLFAGKAKAI